jgi:uncharacterized protein (TIGR02452 family)
MSKNKLIAEKTLEIIEKGEFLNGEKKIYVKEEIEKSISLTFTSNPDNLEELLNQNTLTIGEYETEIEVKNLSTIEALVQENSYQKVAVLNFASAKNPGGGFIGGASAQEESLARSSSLYSSLTKDLTMYKYNKSNTAFLYSDYMIYSPNVLFWMNDDGTFLETLVKVDVITSPAPNKGAMLQHKRQNEIDSIEETFKKRIDKMLALASSQKVECLILGAWGCGVFQNDPKKVANYFKEAIENKYKGQFKKIVFAIFGRKDLSILNIFQETFKN